MERMLNNAKHNFPQFMPHSELENPITILSKYNRKLLVIVDNDDLYNNNNSNMKEKHKCSKHNIFLNTIYSAREKMEYIFRYYTE